MLSFFRINDPYRLLILLLAILAIRLPYLISSAPLIYEIDWMVIGHALTAADTILYKDFLSPIAPLSAFVYTVIDLIFGSHILVYQIASLLLVAYQFSLFNNIMYRNKAYNENTYIPALFYALIMQVFFDFFTLSPVLISLTFILLVLDNIYLRIENKLDDITILKTGFYMGLAVLFYLPSILFFLATIISFVLLTSLIFRRYMLFLYGFFFPIICVALYFLWNDALLDLFNNWIIFTLTYSNKSILNTWSILAIIAFPALIYLLSLYKTFATSRFTNYQVRVQQVMFIMFLAAMGCWLLGNEKAPYQLVISVPFVAFFIAHNVLLYKNKLKAEIFALLFSFLIVGINYYIYSNNKLIGNFSNYFMLNNSRQVYNEQGQGKKLLVLGHTKSMYYNNEVSTPYYYWPLAEKIWANPTNAGNITEIYSSLVKNLPEVIIDEEGVLVAVLNRMPDIAERYERISAKAYNLKNQYRLNQSLPPSLEKD